MSEEAVHDIVGRAVADEAFRRQLTTDPGAALAGYDLTEGERSNLSSLDARSFDEFAGGLSDRATKGFVPGTG